jgi:hypothetical protein
MARSGLFERARLTSAFGGKADISPTLRLMPIYEYTPYPGHVLTVSKPTSAAYASPTLESGGDVIGWHQGDLGLDLDDGLRIQGEPVSLPNGRKDNCCFHEGE